MHWYSKKEKLIRLVPFELLQNVILCFCISVIVFRISDWKIGRNSKFVKFFIFFFQTSFSQNTISWHTGKNILRLPYPINLKLSGIPFRIKDFTRSGKNMSSIDPN